MAKWQEVEESAPEFARAVRALFDAHRHKTMATLTRDGSPRISGTESQFQEGDLWLGSMWGALKARDLQRDPRMALHSASEDPPGWKGDAKISGRAVEITDEFEKKEVLGRWGEVPDGPAHLFRLDVEQVVLTRLGEPADHLVIESWRPGAELKRVERR